MKNGIINVYKEKGFTSFDVVAKMRGMFHQKKIGHTGTLDPDAEGVLPVCLGKATKVCDLLTDKDKEYKAVLLLGQETDTQDISGEVLNTSPIKVTEAEVREAIFSFVGEYEQVPPMYSALKVNGQKLCDLARKGITVERKARPVTIHKIEITDIKLPEVEMIVSCSKGTYIRTLCDDIGKKLGCYGCMKSLLRTKVDKFTVEEALTLSQLQQLMEEKPEQEWNFIEPVDGVFRKYEAVTTTSEAQKMVVNGNRIPVEFISDFSVEKMQENVRLYDFQKKFIGIYTYIEESMEYKPVKLFMD
ncbi:MAG: tRNA pseudouridine(55) synthase TruB [Agathobacter sp.]|nr:tRNA pseudouridine(55) synthase TruB [Agathobacter sp.]